MTGIVRRAGQVVQLEVARLQRVVRRGREVGQLPGLAVDDRRRDAAVVEQRGVGGEALLPHQLLVAERALRRRGTRCAGCAGCPPRVGSKPRAHLLSRSSSVATVTVPAFLNSFVDDAAIFPPGNAPLEQAVADHVDHRDEEYADLVGGFVVSDVKIADLAAGGRASAASVETTGRQPRRHRRRRRDRARGHLGLPLGGPVAARRRVRAARRGGPRPQRAAAGPGRRLPRRAARRRGRLRRAADPAAAARRTAGWPRSTSSPRARST